MYDVYDIAEKILYTASVSDTGEYISNMKLQKLLYYQQGFHLACFGTPLFDNEIEAWMYGPVVPPVYKKYEECGKDGIKYSGTVIELTAEEEDLFDDVMTVYGKYSAIGLVNLTHLEEPWKNTEIGYGNVITQDKLKEYFKTKLT